jgi:tetrahydromethanopterin S-methyltransferase subunit G
MSEEERLRRAFRILFYNQDKIRKEIVEIKARLDELEQKLNNLFRIGDN